MVIVDSSVWIDLLRDRETAETIVFKSIAPREPMGLGDLTLFEVLRGVMPASRMEKVNSYLSEYSIFTMGGTDLMLNAAHNYQLLRSVGIQVATIDCLIATFCIVNGYRLLSSDNHFRSFEQTLGLVMAR